MPDTPQRSLLIYPRRGQLAVFDGRLGHGVLGSSSREQRVTLLINWWAHKPQVGCRTFASAGSHARANRPNLRQPCACRM